jgi:hypothetical protein
LPWGSGNIPEIKVISTEVLKGFIEKAVRTPGMSATGRPEWLEAHRSDLGHTTLSCLDRKTTASTGASCFRSWGIVQQVRTRSTSACRISIPFPTSRPPNWSNSLIIT